MKPWLSRGVAAASLLVAAALLWPRAPAQTPAPSAEGTTSGQGSQRPRAEDRPVRTPAEARAILEEAAKKRIKVAPPTGALAGSLPDEKGRQKVLDIVAVEALKERLLLEKVEREPSFTDSIEEEMLTWQPKLLRLRQTLGDGFPAEQWVVVFKTTRCGLRDGAAHEVLERDLEGQLCMDRLLEYPGGFDGSKPISVSVHPFEEIQRRPEAQGQWWQRLLLEAKKEVTEEFIEAYKKDGRLTL